jgi:hypothetical protein
VTEVARADVPQLEQVHCCPWCETVVEPLRIDFIRDMIVCGPCSMADSACYPGESLHDDNRQDFCWCEK